MFSHFALISVELANSFWPRKLSAAPIGVFFKCEALFEAYVEHFVLRPQIVDEQETVSPARRPDEPQLLQAYPGADLHVRPLMNSVSRRRWVCGAAAYQPYRHRLSGPDTVSSSPTSWTPPDLALLLDDAPQRRLVPLVPYACSRSLFTPRFCSMYFLTGIQPLSMSMDGL